MGDKIFPSIGASVATATLLYPLDYYKTVSQLTYGRALVQAPNQPKFFFAGLLAMNLCVIPKAATRFWVFNYVNNVFGASDSKANPGVIFSSLLAGTLESLVIVPFENVKINMIESSMYLANHKNPFSLPLKGHKPVVKTDSKVFAKPAVKTDSKIFATAKPVQRLEKLLPVSKNILEAVRNVYKADGMYGYFKGANVTLLRQWSSSAAFFWAYNSVKQVIRPEENENESSIPAILSTAVAALAVVAINQPIDVIKSRFQSSHYKQLKYRNLLDCAYKMYVTEGGLAKLYAGLLPRLIRVSLNGSLMMIFFSYLETVV